jgi:fluoroacetyl-CoA thioesterase
MKATLQPGVKHTAKLEVTRDRTIDFMGEKARVYATPSLVRDIEQTCRDLLLQHLDATEDSVGTRVEIDHLAASLMGMPVTLEVEISAVNKRAVTFTVTGSDGIDTICRAVHNRFVVDKAGTEQRLAEKAKKAGLA